MKTTTMRAPTWFRFRALLGLALLCGLAVLAATPAAAQASGEAAPVGKGPHEWHPEAIKAIDELRSPYCPALMLEVCPSSGGIALRDTLEMLAEGGMKSDSIIGWVLARYGNEWLVVPPTSGGGLVAWAVPPLAVLLGIVAVVLVLRRVRKPRSTEPPAEVSEAESARLDAALRELETEEEPLF
jgi:cytochrome c-type biogenesis protein CcmH/NrfF